MKHIRLLNILFVLTLVAIVLSACGAAAPAATEDPAAKYPERDITLVIQASAGGGSDLFARTFANSVGAHKLLPVTIVPDNRPGASGAVAFAYVAEQKADPYFLLNASGQFVTTPILGGAEAANVNYEDFTPIAALASDEFLIGVKADSEYQTLQDLIDAAKAEKDAVLAGGTGLGAPDNICYYLLEKATGADFNYIVFDGGEEVNAALLGGNVDVAIGNPGDFSELVQAGEVRLLGTFADKRLPSLPDVPTVKEQGIDAVYHLVRGFAFPGGVSEEYVTKMEGVIQEYMKTSEWKDYITSNSITENYMDHTAFAAFLKESTELHKQVLTEMGVITTP